VLPKEVKMKANWNTIEAPAKTYRVNMTVQERSDESRRVKALADNEVIAYYRDKSNLPYFRGIALREVMVRKLMTREELDNA
jgi:CMP-2-keto-3-deoxyoctulosonic acid synthetase